MKVTFGLQCVAWIMVLLGMGGMVGVFIPKPPPPPEAMSAIAKETLQMVFFGMANLVLGVGVLRRQPWAVYGTVCFGGAGALWSVLPFLQGYYSSFYIAGLIFYAAACFFSISQLLRNR